MIKLLLTAAFIMFVSSLYAQKDFFVLMKHHQTIQTFIEGSHLTFQFSNGDWITGIITKIQNDSFYFKQEIIHYYTMGTDTQYISGYKIAVKDIHAVPKPTASYNYINDRVVIVPGRESYTFAKDGALFKLGGGGYIALNLINSLTQKSPPFATTNLIHLGIAAAVYLVGVILHKSYKSVFVLAGKYHFEYINMAQK